MSTRGPFENEKADRSNNIALCDGFLCIVCFEGYVIVARYMFRKEVQDGLFLKVYCGFAGKDGSFECGSMGAYTYRIILLMVSVEISLCLPLNVLCFSTLKIRNFIRLLIIIFRYMCTYFPIFTQGFLRFHQYVYRTCCI